MLPSVLLQTSILLWLVCCSLQGGVKPQMNLGFGRLPQPSYLRATQNGFGARTNGKPGKAGYRGVQSGYGGVGFPHGLLHLGGLGRGVIAPKTGYSNGFGVGSYPSTGAQQGYPGGAGVYPSAGLQPGYGVGYGASQRYPEHRLQQGYSNAYGAGAGFRIPSAGIQQHYGNGGYPSVLADMTGDAGAYGGQSVMPLAGSLNDGAKPGKYDSSRLPYGTQPVVPAGLGGDYSAGTNDAGLTSYTAQAAGYGVDPTATKYGETGQFPYGVRPAGLGIQGKVRIYGRAGEFPYRGQSVIPIGLEANANELGYSNGDTQPGGPIAGGYGQLAAGQLDAGQSPISYGGKNSKYGSNGFLQYGRRGACSSGKC